MTVVTANFGSYAQGSNSFSGNTFTATSSSVVQAAYLSDSESTNGRIDYGDAVSLIYSNDPSSTTTISGIYIGYYLDGGVEHPIIRLVSSNDYYLLGETAERSYSIVPADDTQVTQVCYCAGTYIRTALGDVAVERVAIGDLVVTSSGENRRIRWVGRRTIDCRRHPDLEQVSPVCISAHAFGDARPSRDLYVSPAHAICVDALGEVLIPAGLLVNGSTIVQLEVDEVTYWHVELEGGHDILLAENLPAESYLDMGNRGFFREADVVDLAAGPDAAPALRTHADFCRPYVDRGPLLDVVRARLAARAEVLETVAERRCA